MDDFIEKVKYYTEEGYNIGPVISASKFVISASKFTQQNHHFILETNNKKYFLKIYRQIHFERILREINALTNLGKEVAIPKIIQTKEGKYFFCKDGDIFVMYQYIPDQNFKDQKRDGQENSDKLFFDALTIFENKIIELYQEDKSCYDFKDHITRFEVDSSFILEKIRNSNVPCAKNDLEYLQYMMQEFSAMKNKIANLQIPKRIIHGDFTKRNIILDSNGVIWVLDWEKSFPYVTSVDILRSITFALFNPDEDDMGLSVDTFSSWLRYCLKKISLSEQEISHVFNIYYFHLVTNLDILKGVYVDGEDFRKEINTEDFFICKWFKSYKDSVQAKMVLDFF